MAFNYSPKIVTDGLVLCLDAANPRSYVSGSTTWTDLSRTQANGTLTNGPTFNTGNGGSIVFDGVDDYVDCGNATNLQTTVGSVSIWVRTSTPGSSYRGIITKQFTWGLFAKDSILIAYDWGNNADRTTGINIADGTWKNVSVTFTDITGSPSNNATIYLNGNAVLTTTIRINTSVNVNLELARGGSVSGGASQLLNGNIANALMYNRSLSATEVLQNYNATKTRFGL